MYARDVPLGMVQYGRHVLHRHAQVRKSGRYCPTQVVGEGGALQLLVQPIGSPSQFSSELIVVCDDAEGAAFQPPGKGQRNFTLHS